MLSRRVYAFVSKRSAQRLLCKQFTPRKCRVCCQLHARFHTQSQLLKQELDMRLNIDSYEVKDSKENGENRLAQHIKDEEDKQKSHDKNSIGESPQVQSNKERNKKTLEIPYEVYKATKKYVFSDDVMRKKFRVKIYRETKKLMGAMIEGNPEDIEDLTRKISYYKNQLTCLHINIPLKNFNESDSFHIQDSLGITLLGKGGKGFFIIGEGAACRKAFKEIEGISAGKGRLLPSVPKCMTLQEYVEKTSLKRLQKKKPEVPTEQEKKADQKQQNPEAKGHEKVETEPAGEMKQKVIMEQIPKTKQKSEQKRQSPVRKEKLGVLVERLQEKKPEVSTEQKQKADHGQHIPKEKAERLQKRKPEVLTEQKQKADYRQKTPMETGREKVQTEPAGEMKQKVITDQIPKSKQKMKQESHSPVKQEKLGVLVERLQEKKPELPTEQKQKADHSQHVPKERGQERELAQPPREVKQNLTSVQMPKPSQKSKQKEQAHVKQAERLQEKKSKEPTEQKPKTDYRQKIPMERGKLSVLVEKLQEKKPEILTEQKQRADHRRQIPKERGHEKIQSEPAGEIKWKVITEQPKTKQKSEQKSQSPIKQVDKLQERKPEVSIEQKQKIDQRQQMPKERGQEKVLIEQAGELKHKVMLEQVPKTSQKSEQKNPASVDLEKLNVLVERLQDKKPEVSSEQKQKVNHEQFMERGSSETTKAVLQLIELLNETKPEVKTEHAEVWKTEDKEMTRDHKKEGSQTINVPRRFLSYVKDNISEKIQMQTGATLSFRGDKQIAILGDSESVKSCKIELQDVANHTLVVQFPDTFWKKHSFEFKIELNSLEAEHDVTFTWMTDTDLFIYGKEQNVSSTKEAIANFFTLKQFEVSGRIRNAFSPLWMDGVYSRVDRVYPRVKEKEFQEPFIQSDEHVKEEKVEKTETSIDMAENLQPAKRIKSQTKLVEKVAVDLKPRPPVVTIMGHVDHGKTTLLDALRKSKIVDQEFGGITQHIGAFQVQFKTGHSITFLDTPGHAAFSSMRSRGASVTDIVVLVVAAEDGIMDQTLESIRHAKRAKVPVIVAINKIDLPHADPEKVKYDLSCNGLIAEELGGDVQVIPISALKGLNLDKLQESIIAQAEVLELKADPKSKVKARVIESKVDIRRGKQVTAVIENGTLGKGDLLVSGTSSAKVRQMLNEHGKSIKEATPGTPVVVTGWDSLPSAGEFIEEVENEVEMRKMTAERERLEQEKLTEDSMSLAEERRTKFHADYMNMRKLKRELHWKQYNKIREQRKGDIVETGLPKFPVILKADVDGSLEVLEETLAGFYSEHVELSIVSSGVGDVNEGDYTLAQSVGARIYGFNVKEASMHREGPSVPVTLDNVIYDLFDNMVDDIKETLPIIETTNEIGRGEVVQTFVVTDAEHGKTTVAGCRCKSGMFKKDCLYRIIRNNQVVYEGNLTSMRILKNSVTTANEGSECGLGLAEKTDIQEKDEVICLEKVSQRADLEWDHGLQHG